MMLSKNYEFIKSEECVRESEVTWNTTFESNFSCQGGDGFSILKVLAYYNHLKIYEVFVYERELREVWGGFRGFSGVVGGFLEG